MNLTKLEEIAKIFSENKEGINLLPNYFEKEI
jgi:hypothetical protein